MRTASIIRNKMDLVCQARGRGKPREEVVGASVRRGRGCAPRQSTLPLCVWAQAGREAPPCSPTHRWRGHGKTGSSMAENVGNVLMGREKQDSHWEIAFWLPGRLSVLGVAGCQPTGGSTLSLV